ncbi:hypothetical protein FRC08_016064 [Ceratobasidium sp. 394]|nr:hypothetical protein FRC08_016064 [Ceratobasidium sp. 394]KAG9089233.1 hypothetical protein FS749_001505 [Ceratobasidium sp. UAMH 11750]
MTIFRFKPFTNDSTPHAQLQEWADYYHVELRWEEIKTQEQGTTEWTSYPIIQGKHYSSFTGSGKAQKFSRAAAAEQIIACPGVLDAARA